MSKTKEKSNPKFYKSYSPNTEPFLTLEEVFYEMLAMRAGYLRELAANPSK